MSKFVDGPEGASVVNLGGTPSVFSSAPSVGGLLACGTGQTVKVLPTGTAGQVLQSSGAADAVFTSSVALSSMTLTTPLAVASGGTGATTALTGNRLMWSIGGTIVEATALQDGECFIGSTGAAPVAARITAGANISRTTGPGTLTLAAIPSGGTGEVQFNNGGAFGATSALTYNTVSSALSVIGGSLGQNRLIVGGSTSVGSSTVYIESNTTSENDGQRVYFNSGTPTTSGYITYSYDLNTPYIAITDGDDDPPYLVFNTIGSGTYTAPLYTSVFGARGAPASRVSGNNSGFAWYVGANVQPKTLIGTTPAMELDSGWLKIPSGSNATRPAWSSNPVGVIRHNSDASRFEIYDSVTTEGLWTTLTGVVARWITPITATTAAETIIILYDIPGGTLGTDGCLRIQAGGIWENLSGANRSCTIRLQVGFGVTIYEDTTPNLGNGVRTGWSIDLRLFANGSTTSQILTGVIDFGPVGAPTTGFVGNLTATKFATANVFATASQNSAALTSFLMRVAFSGANPGFTLRWYTVEKI